MHVLKRHKQTASWDTLRVRHIQQVDSSYEIAAVLGLVQIIIAELGVGPSAHSYTLVLCAHSPLRGGLLFVMIKAVVLDIEGTVCPISFVKDVLYPYALKKAKDVLKTVEFPVVSSKGELEAHLAEFPREYASSPNAVLEHMAYLTARDVKAPYLKSLQGYLWREGYSSGEIKVSLFGDAAPAIKRWSESLKQYGEPAGVYIYSSGSVPAQKLLFAHTTQGDLNGLLSGYFDTVNAGPKTEAGSYEKIAAAIGLPASEIIFFSDNPKEIEAAEVSGWSTVYTVREGNAPTPAAFKPTGKVSSDFSNINF